MSLEERSSTLKTLTRGIVVVGSLFAAMILCIIALFVSKSAQIKVDYYKDSEAVTEYQNRVSEKEVVIESLYDSIYNVRMSLAQVTKEKRTGDSILEIKLNTIKKLNEKVSSLSDSLVRNKRITKFSDLESIK